MDDKGMLLSNAEDKKRIVLGTAELSVKPCVILQENISLSKSKKEKKIFKTKQ